VQILSAAVVRAGGAERVVKGLMLRNMSKRMSRRALMWKDLPQDCEVVSKMNQGADIAKNVIKCRRLTLR
jgi:hypothetical protein